MIGRADSRVSFAKVRGRPARLSPVNVVPSHCCGSKIILTVVALLLLSLSLPLSSLSNYHHSYSNGPPGDTGCMAGLPQGKRIVLRQVYSYLDLLFSRL